MEAESVEDDGAGISFYVYVYNVQPGIEIDYVTEKAVKRRIHRQRQGQKTVRQQRKLIYSIQIQ